MKKELLKALAANLKTEKDFDQFFGDLLTPKEYHDLVERFAICQKLHEGKTVREITEELGVASATVVRGNRLLKYENHIIKNLLK